MRAPRPRALPLGRGRAAARGRHLRAARRSSRSIAPATSRRRCSVRSCTSCAGGPTRSMRLLDDIAGNGYGAHARHSFAHRHDRRADRGAASARQCLRQPQHDRRRGRHAAVRRHRPFRHRPEGRRPELSARASRPSRWSPSTPRPPAATRACWRRRSDYLGDGSLLSSPRRRGPITTEALVAEGRAISLGCGVRSPLARGRQQQLLPTPSRRRSPHPASALASRRSRA